MRVGKDFQKLVLNCPTDSGEGKIMTSNHTNREKPLTLNVTTYNARSLLTEGKVIGMETEMPKIKWRLSVSKVKQRVKA